MALLSSSSCFMNKAVFPVFQHDLCRTPKFARQSRRPATKVAAFFDPREDPIVKEALKEPIAFLGGVFAGMLRLDLNEEPLKGWIEKTAAAAKLQADEKLETITDKDDGGPEEIQIE